MAYLVLDTLVPVDPPAWGSSRPTGTALLEPWVDPGECGLYERPQGFSGPQRLMDVVADGNHSVIGLPRRPRSEG